SALMDYGRMKLLYGEMLSGTVGHTHFHKTYVQYVAEEGAAAQALPVEMTTQMQELVVNVSCDAPNSRVSVTSGLSPVKWVLTDKAVAKGRVYQLKISLAPETVNHIGIFFEENIGGSWNYIDFKRYTISQVSGGETAAGSGASDVGGGAAAGATQQTGQAITAGGMVSPSTPGVATPTVTVAPTVAPTVTPQQPSTPTAEPTEEIMARLAGTYVWEPTSVIADGKIEVRENTMSVSVLKRDGTFVNAAISIGQGEGGRDEIITSTSRDWFLKDGYMFTRTSAGGYAVYEISGTSLIRRYSSVPREIIYGTKVEDLPEKNICQWDGNIIYKRVSDNEDTSYEYFQSLIK
ncbi:MAG: hypothetical protein PHG48_07735, partial [Eubacteriales bacterium]|nr:hypothetical protein [Eubacteriales bacterium]